MQSVHCNCFGDCSQDNPTAGKRRGKGTQTDKLHQPAEAAAQAVAAWACKSYRRTASAVQACTVRRDMAS